MPHHLTILLVDDHNFNNDLLQKHLLSEQIALTVHRACNGSQALELLSQHKIDIVFMDYNMPQMDGIVCTRNIKQLYPHVKVLFISSTSDPQKVQQAMLAGADGYISKVTGIASIPEALQIIFAGGSYLCTEAKSAMLKAVIESTKKEARFKQYKFTSRQLEIAPLMAEGKSDQQIADKLFLSAKTVNGHRQKIYQITGIHKYTEFMAFFNENKDKFISVNKDN